MALDPNHLTAVNRLLLQLGREGRRFYSDTAYRPWSGLATHHKAITTSEELEALLPSADRLAGNLEGRAIPLAPSRESAKAAAFLRAEWNFEGEADLLKYYLVLYYGEQAGARPHLGLSFRLEQPEGGGTHDYWHLQMCKDVASDRATPVISSHPHTPTSYPAFPINAADAVSLTASLSVAISGRPGLNAAITALQGQGPLQASLRTRYSKAPA